MPELDQRGRVIVIDDEPAIATSISRQLERSGYEVQAFNDPQKALLALENHSPDVVLTDVRMPSMNGIELCKAIKERNADVEVVVMTGHGTVEVAVQAMKAGAYDFLCKPFETLEVVSLAMHKAVERKRLRQRNRYLESRVELSSKFENLVGESAKMKAVFRLIERVAKTDVTVLITGESGTGKELVARAIYELGDRANKPFLALNCSAFSENLLESELFGHVKGAFTGATGAHRGLFDEANGGTLFLDEIGDTPLPTQVKLLRALQEGEIKPVGSNEIKKVNVRILAATNVDLEHAIKKGTFREDLFYRLNVIAIPLPPLRERPEDVPALAHHFLVKHVSRLKKKVEGFKPEVLNQLSSYRWPGNVRELENTVERAIVLSQENLISASDLPEGLLAHRAESSTAPMVDELYQVAKHRAISAFDVMYLKDTMTRAGGVVAEAARLAGMDRSNFRKLLHQYEIDPDQFRHS
jgi:DNA-binding NtrC family response regulator